MNYRTHNPFEMKLFLLRDYNNDSFHLLKAEATDELATLIPLVIEAHRDCDVASVDADYEEMEQALQEVESPYDFVVNVRYNDSWDEELVCAVVCLKPLGLSSFGIF